jgi:hypothetical protein
MRWPSRAAAPRSRIVLGSQCMLHQRPGHLTERQPTRIDAPRSGLAVATRQAGAAHDSARGTASVTGPLSNASGSARFAATAFSGSSGTGGVRASSTRRRASIASPRV